MTNLTNLIKKIEQKQDLSEQESENLMLEIMEGKIPEDQVKKLLILLAEKGESIEEISGFARAMRTKSLHIEAPAAADNCGTGGSGLSRVNTSTIAAFVAAAAGAKIAKHGNKAAGGRCGSFDVLEASGININLDPLRAQKCFDNCGLTFLYARIFHPAMKHVAPVRKKIEGPTVFNILGPLTNPSGVKKQVLGISNKKLAPKMIQVLKNLGSEHVLLLHGTYNLDEIGPHGPTHIWELKNKEIEEYDIKPEDFGINTCKLAYIKGGDIEYNRRVMKSVLENKDREYRTEMVLLNAGALLYVAGIAAGIKEGYEIAKSTLESKKALEKFNEYKELSNSF